jgi:Phosphatidylinositol 3- and 4-kinase
MTISGQLDLAFNPFEKRGAHGEWGAGALLKAHDTASATASADARAKLAADWDAKRAERKAVPRHYVGVKPAPGKTIMMVDPDRPSEIAYVRRHPMAGHVDVEHADGRHEVMPAQFIDHPMLPNMFHGGSPVRGAPNTLAGILPPGAGSLMRGQMAHQETGAGAKFLRDNQAPSPAAQLAALRAKIEVHRAERRARVEADRIAHPPPPEVVAPADPAHADDPVSKQLDADAASGIKEVQSPKDRARKAGLNPAYFGNSAQTSVVTFGNGHQWIRKRGLDEDEMHREVLVSRISDVLGAGAPQVTLRPDGTTKDWKTPSQEMWEPVVPSAVPAVAWIGNQDDPGNKHDQYDMMASRQGAKIGLLDTITSNYDRHEGNWMVQHSDNPYVADIPVPIDHGHAMMNDSQGVSEGGTGPFGQHLFQYGADSEQLAAVPKEAWAAWEKGVKALAPQFKEAGMHGQFVNVQAALSAAAHLSARAKKETGTAPAAPAKWTGPAQ